MAKLRPIVGVEHPRRSKKNVRELRNVKLWVNDEERAVIVRSADHVEVEFFEGGNKIRIVMQKDGAGVLVKECKGDEVIGGGRLE